MMLRNVAPCCAVWRSVGSFCAFGEVVAPRPLRQARRWGRAAPRTGAVGSFCAFALMMLRNVAPCGAARRSWVRFAERGQSASAAQEGMIGPEPRIPEALTRRAVGFGYRLRCEPGLSDRE